MLKNKKIIKSNNTNNNEKKIHIIDSAPVFEFINPNSNDELSKMNGYDLQDLIVLIDDYYIQLRKCLGLERYITFGLELEFENAMIDRINEQLIDTFPNREWRTKYDGSLNDGAEISSPILNDCEVSWKNLDKTCSIVSPFASIGENSGGHIHIGTQTLGADKKSWLNFLKIWAVYENIIFRFAYGDFLTARPKILEYAEPMAKEILLGYEETKKKNTNLSRIIFSFSHSRYQAVNFNNVFRNECNNFKKGNTIEFRCPNGTFDSAIWQNNVNFFAKLLIYSKSASFNNDIIEQRKRSNDNRFMTLKFYDEIYLEQALELCDLVFTNNFDKVYFLRQYLKSFQIYSKDNDCKKALTLTKK